MRQHPIKILGYTSKTLWLLLIPIGKNLVTSNFDIQGWLKTYWLDLFVVLWIMLFAVFKWLFVFYKIGDGCITAHTGPFGVIKTTVYFSQISSIRVEQGIIARAFHASTLNLETQAKSITRSDIRLVISEKHINEIFELVAAKSENKPQFAVQPNNGLVVIYSVMFSSALSGSAQQALLLSREEKYRGRVFVADNRRVSITQQQALLDARNLIRKGYGPGEIVKVLQENADENAIYIAMGTLEYLKRGGRITPAAAAIGTFLKIRPVLSIPAGGALDTYRTGRTAKQCRQIMLEALRRDARERFHDPSCRHCDLAVAYSDDRESAEVFARELGEAFPEKRGRIPVRRLSLLLSCHIGPGAVGAAIMPRLKAAAAATSAVA